MTDKDVEVLVAVVSTVIAICIFVIGFGFGVDRGREEYNAELHKQVEENNRLLKEIIALRERETERGLQ